MKPGGREGEGEGEGGGRGGGREEGRGGGERGEGGRRGGGERGEGGRRGGGRDISNLCNEIVESCTSNGRPIVSAGPPAKLIQNHQGLSCSLLHYVSCFLLFSAA